MDKILNESNIHEYLTAFADGELDAAQILAVLNYLATHPEALEMMRGQQQLRLEADRVVRDNTPPVPNELRQRIQSMAEKTDTLVEKAPIPSATPVSSNTSPRRRKHVWFMVAIPPTLITSVTKIHVDCSRFEPQLHAGPFPTAPPYDTLAKEVKEEFHSQVPYPDLSSIGYSLIGAGPCRKPLENTVHLLYGSTKPTVRDTLSIFVQPYTAQVQVEPGHMILVSGDVPHPMFVWRSDRAVYFLVTDDLETADKAREVMQVAMSR